MVSTALVRTYLRLGAAYAQRDLARSTLRQRRKILQLTRIRLAAQLDSRLQLIQAESALPAIRERPSAKR